MENGGETVPGTHALPCCPVNAVNEAKDLSCLDEAHSREIIDDMSDDDGDEGDDDNDDDSDIEDPSEDIRGDLADILSGDLEFAGTFSFSKTYPAAPNPALAVGDIGTIGLPLSTRDAAAIKAHAEQAPFGKADKTIVDKSVRDTWEIDAKEVRFDNPAWTTFLDNVIREVCEVLGVDVQASKPFCELYKLLLYETGSHFLPHVDTEKVNGMFATVVIALPSKFTGGAVQVKHGDMTQVYDCSAGSLYNTTVLAWYTDVEHEVKAVTSGYRLALSFNLMHTTNSLRPTLSVNNLPARLRRVLLSWERGKGDTDAPAKIIYLLSHKYSHANLSGSALKGVDAHLIAVLDNVGRPYGIHIGLANLTCTQRGSAEDYGDSSYRWGRCAYDDDVGMMEVEDTEVVIEHLVDLDGRLIQESVTCDIEFEVIPDELVDEITAGDYDDQEYEGYQGNYAGSLERFYRRTVLVMWPSWAHFDMIHGSNGLSYACQKIRASTSSHPTAEEKELVDIILARAGPSHCAAVVSSLCHAALVWRDLSLWTRAVNKCNAERSVTTLQEGNILKAVKTFGFSSIQPCLERTLENDPSSIFALQFLERFEVWVASQNVEELSSTTKDWIAAQRTRCFEHLKTPGKDEYESLTALALKYGGIEFLETRIIPRVISSGESTNILEFALFIGKKDSVDSEARARMAKALLAAALSGIGFYSVVPPAPTKTPAYYSSYNSVPETSAQLERAKQYLGACLDFDFDDLLATTVDKLLGLAGQPDTVVLSRVKEILFPLIAFAEERLRSRPGCISPPALRKLSSTASSLYIKSVMARPTAMSPYDVSSMIQAVISAGEPDQVITQVVPKLEGLKLDVSVLRSIIEEVHRRRAQIDPDGTRVKSALLRLLKKYIGGISLVAPTYSASYYLATVNRTKPVLDALEFCLTVQLPEGCTFVFQRLLNPPKLDSQYITTQLAPLVPDICPFLMKHKLSLNQEPFATALRAIMLYWVQKVMGPRPSEVPQTYMNALRAWTCRCEICPAVRAFLTSKPEESMSWTRIGAPKRKHVENFLATHARAIATYDTIRSTPQGLIVKKNQILVAPARWTHNQKEGKRLLASISSNVDELKAVLGADYLRITALLDGLTVPASASTDAAAGSSRRRLAQQAAGGQQLPPAAPAASGSVAHHGTAPGVSTLQAPTISQGPSQNIQASRMSQTLSSAGPVPVATTSHTVDQPPAKRRKMAYNAHDVIDLT